MWRPAGSRCEEIQRFFIGGAPRLRDITMSGCGPDFEDSFFARYGFTTLASGGFDHDCSRLELRLNCVHHQAQAAVPDHVVSADTPPAGMTTTAALSRLVADVKKKNASTAHWRSNSSGTKPEAPPDNLTRVRAQLQLAKKSKQIRETIRQRLDVL